MLVQVTTWCHQATNPYLTYLPLVPHICVIESGQHWFGYWLVAGRHHLNQCWVIVNWALRNKFQWNFNQDIKIFIHENVSENIICEMAAILSSGRSVKPVMSELWKCPYWISICSNTLLMKPITLCVELFWKKNMNMILRLTHWGRDKMAAILQTTYSNPFSWMKMYEFGFKFHCNLVLRV